MGKLRVSWCWLSGKWPFFVRVVYHYCCTFTEAPPFDGTVPACALSLAEKSLDTRTTFVRERTSEQQGNQPPKSSGPSWQMVFTPGLPPNTIHILESGCSPPLIIATFAFSSSNRCRKIYSSRTHDRCQRSHVKTKSQGDAMDEKLLGSGFISLHVRRPMPGCCGSHKKQ